MSNVLTPFPRSETAGARLMASIWSAYYAALWRGDLAASSFAEWLAGFWEPRLERPDGTPDARSALAADGRGIEWFERDGWVYGDRSRPQRRIPAAARRDPGTPLAEGHGARRVIRNEFLHARDGFLRYDEPGTTVPGLLFPAAIRAGDGTGSQGRPPSMMGRGDGNITIGHVWGIPIQINPSTFLILALVTWTLAGGVCSRTRTRS